MTLFNDGPAEGVTLLLRRAPLYLRAVRAPSGEWDALDLLDDRPEHNETIVAYVRVGEPTHLHVCVRPRSSRSFSGGSYTAVTPQPSDEVLRDQAQWQAWTREQVAAQSIGV